MGYVLRVRFASFFAGAAVASSAGFYFLHKDYKIAHQSMSKQSFMKLQKFVTLHQSFGCNFVLTGVSCMTSIASVLWLALLNFMYDTSTNARRKVIYGTRSLLTKKVRNQHPGKLLSVKLEMTDDIEGVKRDAKNAEMLGLMGLNPRRDSPYVMGDIVDSYLSLYLVGSSGKRVVGRGSTEKVGRGSPGKGNGSGSQDLQVANQYIIRSKLTSCYQIDILFSHSVVMQLCVLHMLGKSKEIEASEAVEDVRMRKSFDPLVVPTFAQTLTMNDLYKSLDGRISSLENLKEIEALKPVEDAE
ncbi:hypothetical protein Tco_0760281 [Tanacetum coccineum]